MLLDADFLTRGFAVAVAAWRKMELKVRVSSCKKKKPCFVWLNEYCEGVF
jgi:hypothetical protein